MLLLAAGVLAPATAGRAIDRALVDRAAAPHPAGSPAGPVEHFSPEIFLSHVYYLASDELNGRDVGTAGIRRAGQYIADHFAQAGLEPGGEDGSYFQRFTVNLGRRLTGDSELAITGAHLDDLVLGEDYLPFPWSSDRPFGGGVVFAGYGLVDPEREHDDYAGLEVTGKVVLMLRREPPAWNRPGGRPSRQARFVHKVALARQRGAAGVLIVNRRPGAGREDRLVPFRGGSDDCGLPAVHIKRAVANRMLAAGGLASLQVLQGHLDAATPRHCSAPLAGVMVRGRAGLSEKGVEARNVIGLLRGSGPHAGEYLVIAAHYDHVGQRARGSPFAPPAESPEAIHNGADDNASGTAALIEIARRLARERPLDRSVLAIAFSAEEMGLRGSEHFVEHPTVPRERIVACLNMDMIGRMPENADLVNVFGLDTGRGLADTVYRCADRLDLEVLGSPSPTGRADEASFQVAGIPGLHFFTGLHADYHRPSDDADRINEYGGARVAGLVYEIARELIAAETRPAYHDVATYASLRRPGRQRPMMGFRPGTTEAGGAAGLLVDAVNTDGPARSAGMRPGDRIVRMGDRQINGLADFLTALRGHQPGKEVEVVVLRDGAEVRLTVRLAAGGPR